MEKGRKVYSLIRIKKIITYFGFLAAFFLTLNLPAVLATALDNTVSGTYKVTVAWGDGLSNEETYSLSSGPTDPLAYSDNISSGSASASAAAGFWGYGDVETIWGWWMTDGTGVSQTDPDHELGETRMTIAFDVTVNDPTIGDVMGQWGVWYDMFFLQGNVTGEDSYVGFSSNVNMYRGIGGGSEELVNLATWEFSKNTSGSFYIDSGFVTPEPTFNEWLLPDEYMRFEGTYTFYANNDGGPVSIGFTDTPPPPVPEPSTIFLFGLGLLSLAGVNRRKQ
ncbi:MAG: PEP-CTERM sorting domain-containing protein [Desulfobacteraceae bacterium]|nr:PEP-CTERM sorting domain-containing protein [Desulfobacteraceae bacterium]